MPILLNKNVPFPDPSLADPEGLVAIGGDLNVDRLLAAYRKGIFPWTVDPITWWSPDPRAIFELDGFHVSQSLARIIRQGRFEVTIDQSFHAVMEGCATPTPGRSGAWITEEFIEAYTRLHRQGHDERARGLPPVQHGATRLPRRADGICGRIRPKQENPLAENQRLGIAQIPVGRKRNECSGFVPHFEHQPQSGRDDSARRTAVDAGARPHVGKTFLRVRRFVPPVKALSQCSFTDRIRLVNTGHQTAGRHRNPAPRIPATPDRAGNERTQHLRPAGQRETNRIQRVQGHGQRLRYHLAREIGGGF